MAQYYAKLKKLWDELACLTPIPECRCRKAKAILVSLESNKLVQFLMGLSEIYDSIRGNVLLMEPFPNVNKTYSMVL